MADSATQAPTGPARPSGAVIAATKLHVPAARHGLVSRASLVATLTEATEAHKLTLLAAPPGAGKTTLLSEWHTSLRASTPFAWLSLDVADNDPVRFWSGVIEALRTIESDLGAEALATVRVTNVGLEEVVLPLLVNDLTALGRQLVLVLDDFHVVHQPRIYESLAFLIDHLPSNVHLALATRADPPLPLGRYRARGEMTVIRAPQLRFSDAEAEALLNGALQLELDARDVARLQERTEGWAAGLYLAALSLRGRSDPAGFIDSFAGDDRQIVDYLASEVLAGQPEPLRAFLLHTCVLERLSGPLCDALTRRSDSARTLEQLERSNLFLVPLDDNRVWYRYHQLFGELLRHELAVSGRDLVATLHGRARDWYLEQGSPSDAIHHATLAGDHEGARELIAVHWRELFNQGRLGTVAAWLDSVPADQLAADPRLCIARAWLALDQGRVKEASCWIDGTDGLLLLSSSRDRAADVLRSDAAVLRAVHSFKVGDVGAAHASAQRVLELEPDGHSFALVVAHCILGITCYWRGDLPEASGPLEEAARLARASGNDLGRSYALGYLALAQVDGGAVDEAGRLAGEAAGVSDDPGFREHFVTMMGHLARARVAESGGRLGEAAAEATRAVELSRRGAGRLEIAAALLTLGKVRQSLGAAEEARRLLADARDTLEGCADPGAFAGAVRATRRAVAGAPPGHRAQRPLEALTDRELAVLRLLKSDLSRREIGDALYVSQNTVKTHVRGIYRKLDVSTRQEAVARARELALL